MPPRGYYDAYEDITIGEIVDRWAMRGEKMTSDSMPLLYDPEAIWPYREYTWTRETARQSFEGDDAPPDTRYWDALVESLGENGWDPKDPAIVQVGANGIAKVGEGNHRVAIARQLGILVPARFVFSQKVHVDPKLRADPWYGYHQRKKRPKRKVPAKRKQPAKRKTPLTEDERRQVDEIMELLGRR